MPKKYGAYSIELVNRENEVHCVDLSTAKAFIGEQVLDNNKTTSYQKALKVYQQAKEELADKFEFIALVGLNGNNKSNIYSTNL